MASYERGDFVWKVCGAVRAKPSDGCADMMLRRRCLVYWIAVCVWLLG